MREEDKEKEELMTESVKLRQRISQLEKLEAEYSKMLDVAGVIIVVIAANQRVSFINKKGCGILGYKKEEIIGQNWFDNFIRGRIREEIRCVFGRLIREEIELIKYFENPVLTRSGQERIIAWYNAYLKDEKGIIYATLSSGEDITEHKKATFLFLTVFGRNQESSSGLNQRTN